MSFPGLGSTTRRLIGHARLHSSSCRTEYPHLLLLPHHGLRHDRCPAGRLLQHLPPSDNPNPPPSSPPPTVYVIDAAPPPTPHTPPPRPPPPPPRRRGVRGGRGGGAGKPPR